MFSWSDNGSSGAAPQPPSGVSLNHILPDATFLNTQNLCVGSCSGMWNECQSNDLFVALVDADHDGHEYADRAIGRGATAVLGERMLPIVSPQCIVPDSRIAYGKVCHALAGKPSEHLRTIGISGTDGKTTTAHLIHSIFEEAGLTAGLSSSIAPGGCPGTGNRGQSNLKKHNVAPQIANWISDVVLQGNRFALLETGSIALAQHHLAGIELDVAVLTNIRGSNFDFHGSLANYRRAQLRLLDYLKPTGLAVVNADDPSSYFVLDRLDCPAITIAIRQPAEIEATPLTSDLSEQTFLITAGRQTVTIRTRLIGRHHIYNALAAAAVSLTHEIDLPTIARGIERVTKLPGRLDAISCGQTFHVATDISNTPYRLAVALRTLKNACSGRVICVFSTSPEDTKEMCGQFGRVAERTCDLSIITLNRAEKKQIHYEAAHRILDGFDRPQRGHLIPDRIKAIEWALAQAKPGDAVLIAGNGERPIAELGDDRWHITDRDVCESWLYNHVSLQPPTARPSDRPSADIFRLDDYR